jgi:tRNA pseudouridine13 synthase
MPLRTRSALDEQLGMRYYSTERDGIGGVLRERVEDFIVVELALGKVPCTPGCSKELGGGAGDYLWLLLEKRGIDTVTALRALARAIGVDRRKLSVAGLKDAKAVAFQLVCVEGVEPESVPMQIGDKLRVHEVFKMPFKLTTGMLYGNFFSVNVRKLEAPLEEAAKRVGEIAEELRRAGGAPNYYGYQRFGTIRPITHVVGKYVLLGRLEDAVWELLTRVFPLESPKAKEFRSYLASTRDIQGALKLVPRRLHHERAILEHLAKRPGDYAGALRKLPVAVRSLFVEAYQAYLFNLVLSRRLEEGLPLSKPVPGDLVALLAGSGLRLIRCRESNVDKLRALVERGEAEVVGNVFGYATVLAEGLPGMIEREVLASEGVSLELFQVRSMPEAATRGTVRPLALRPESFEWFCVDGDDPCISFSFVLRKGMFATVLLREFVKPCDPARQGF